MIRGSFARAGQEDWAVLCSRDGVSRILVFWGGPARCPLPIGDPEADRNWLQGIGRDEIGYFRQIRAVGRGFILRMHEEFGGPEPPPIEHRGIEEYFVKKASSVLYCYRGKWLRLRGLDPASGAGGSACRATARGSPRPAAVTSPAPDLLAAIGSTCSSRVPGSAHLP